MDKDKQRRLILEAQGWSELSRAGRRGEDGPIGALRGTSPDGRKNQLAPNPLTNLNAMHEAVISLPDDKQGEFRRHLEDVIRGRKLGYQKVGISLMGKEEYTRWFNATAAQRAEAFLRTLNLWQPEPERRGGDL